MRGARKQSDRNKKMREREKRQSKTRYKLPTVFDVLPDSQALSPQIGSGDGARRAGSTRFCSVKKYRVLLARAAAGGSVCLKAKLRALDRREQVHLARRQAVDLHGRLRAPMGGTRRQEGRYMRRVENTIFCTLKKKRIQTGNSLDRNLVSIFCFESAPIRLISVQ